MDAVAKPRSSANASQSLHRAFVLLRVVAGAGVAGIRLSDAAAQAGLHVATAHRLLAGLLRERAVSFDPYSRLYHLGHGFLEMRYHTREHQIRLLFRPVLERIGALTEDTVHLSTSTGNDALCIDRVEGTFPIRANTLDVGARRPLGVGAGSLALLAALPEARAHLVMRANEERYAQYRGLEPDEIRVLVEQARRAGYAFNSARIIDGVSGVGVAIPDGAGNAVAAVSVAAISERLPPARQRQIAGWIHEEAGKLSLPAAPTLHST